MPSDSGATRLMYPELPEPLTAADLHRLFTPSYQERKWAPTIARAVGSQVDLHRRIDQIRRIRARPGECAGSHALPAPPRGAQPQMKELDRN